MDQTQSSGQDSVNTNAIPKTFPEALQSVLSEDGLKLIQDNIQSHSFKLEEEFAKILAELQEQADEAGKKMDVAAIIAEELTQTIAANLNLRMAEVFTDEDLNNLQNAFNTGMTQPQRQLLTRKLFEAKTGESVEEFIAKKYEEAMKSIIKEHNATKQMMDNIAKLSDEEAEILNILAEKNYGEEASYLLKYLTQNDSADPEYVPPHMDIDTMDKITAALRDKDISTARRIAEGLEKYDYI